MSLYGWERERIADAIFLLSGDARPRNARRLQRQMYEVWVGEARVLYRIVRNRGQDIGLIVTRIS